MRDTGSGRDTLPLAAVCGSSRPPPSPPQSYALAVERVAWRGEFQASFASTVAANNPTVGKMGRAEMSQSAMPGTIAILLGQSAARIVQ